MIDHRQAGGYPGLQPGYTAPGSITLAGALQLQACLVSTFSTGGGCSPCSSGRKCAAGLYTGFARCWLAVLRCGSCRKPPCGRLASPRTAGAGAFTFTLNLLIGPQKGATPPEAEARPVRVRR